MAKEHSLDIVSKVDMQILKDAINVSEKIVKGRYDLKGGDNKIELKEKDKQIVLLAESDMGLKALREILSQNCIKKNISIKAFEEKEKEKAFSGNIRQVLNIKQGIDKLTSGKINKFIKEGKYKVKTQIQDEQIRVTGKDIDVLQELIKLLREKEDIEIALQFINFR